jgi:hypothetical protein
MRCNVILIVAAIFLCSSAVARGKQAPGSPTSSQAGSPTSTGPARDCRSDFDTLHEVRRTEDRDQRPPQTQSDAVGASETADGAPAAVNLEQDLKILEQRQSGLAQCILATNRQEPQQDSQGACFGELLMNFEMRHDGEISRLGGCPEVRVFFMNLE